MDLYLELIKVLERAKEEDSYFNPYAISGVLEIIQECYPDYDKIISNELEDWASNMFSR